MITNRHYLLKVLGISAAPKLITFALTLISFPLLLRSLGAENYGVVMLIGSALGLFELLLDFGVSSAAGKSIAAVRAHYPTAIREEFLAWVKLQVLFVCLGYVPMLLAAYLMLKGSPSFQDTTLLLVMSVGVVFNVILSFIRPNLQSLLAFKSMAVLDTFESLMRSLGFLIVSFNFPSPFGLAVAGLANSVITSALAVILITLRISASPGTKPLLGSVNPSRDVTLKDRLLESASFLWLRLSSRLFQEVPIIMLGRLLGAEIIGVIGAARKIIDLLGVPYLVIGNALMVRIQEISRDGRSALIDVWNTALRIVSTSFPIFFILVLGSQSLTSFSLPNNLSALQQFSLMLLFFLPYIVACLVTPMSDYFGGLLLRNILLSVMAIVQIPVIWFAAVHLDAQGALSTYVGCYSFMIVGYTFIASKVITGHWSPSIKPEIIIFTIFLAVAFVIAAKLSPVIPIEIKNQDNSPDFVEIYKITLFVVISFILVGLNKKTRQFYFSRKFFELTP